MVVAVRNSRTAGSMTVMTPFARTPGATCRGCRDDCFVVGSGVESAERTWRGSYRGNTGFGGVQGGIDGVFCGPSGRIEEIGKREGWIG